jgi:hypothetical protein
MVGDTGIRVNLVVVGRFWLCRSVNVAARVNATNSLGFSFLSRMVFRGFLFDKGL